ncbi:arsenite efflux transporter metallochaperone ArsD [Roseinatronobacter monicus]|uniref:Arsenical resistance operon trans-acting repressor ArsD n=1 Tax=Roseinatronobacter monicus TaxID=393481 RepID=A0A543K328_9RHOB|nr:arsenite efflux transporter metallochaperone ArsD [Roseinatronobacter monicus]TQM89498.1 arsenical resistance operon trans-acting repressor ArsD [Roseinatronobacter monicus]
MTTLTVYDPAMCCSTGICGTDIDQKLITLAADLDWLRAQGVQVQRFGLSREPAEFVVNDQIRDLMQASGGDDLPAFVVDGKLVAKAHYPDRTELAAWAGVALAQEMRRSKPGGCCCGPANAEPKQGACC